MQQTNNFTTALGLDIGAKRIGVARVSAIAKLPEPLMTLENTDSFMDQLSAIIAEHGVDLIVVGLPRNMSGGETSQTGVVREFVAARLEPYTKIPIIYQDETLTSVAAEAYPPELQKKVGSDAIAAAEILTDYIRAL